MAESLQWTNETLTVGKPQAGSEKLLRSNPSGKALTVGGNTSETFETSGDE